MQRRANDIDHRRKELQQRRDTLIDQRRELTRDNQLRTRIAGFAERVLAVIDQLTFDQRQQLLRLVVEEVRVTGWNVQIQLPIPLDDPPAEQPLPAR
jgi:site-specific DNA recombinase